MSDAKPPGSSSQQRDSRSASASSEQQESQWVIDKEMAQALLSGVRGAEYELRKQREDIETAERLSRGRDEVTHGHAIKTRAEIGEQRAEFGALRKTVVELNSLVRERVEIEQQKVADAKLLGPDGLPRISRWEAAGWGIPSPHAVYTFLFVVAEAVRESDFFPVGSLGARAAALAVAAFTLLGINAAKNHLSLQVRTKLRAFDAKALEDVHSLPSHKETP